MSDNQINAAEADPTRHELVRSENGEIVRAEGHIVVFDNIDKNMYCVLENERNLRLFGLIPTALQFDTVPETSMSSSETLGSHPDSPYTIDSYHALPRNLLRSRDESISMRGHSPSPCDSLRSSSTQSKRVTDPATVRDNSSQLLSVPSLSLSLERRASEGTVARNRRDPASQIALAEEIIKLSEHLRSIAMESRVNEENNGGPMEAQRFTRRPGDVGNNRDTYSRSNVKVTSHVDKETNEITEKLSSITRQRKLNGTTFHSSRSFDRHNLDPNFGNVFVALRRTSIGDGDISERHPTHIRTYF